MITKRTRLTLSAVNVMKVRLSRRACLTFLSKINTHLAPSRVSHTALSSPAKCLDEAVSVYLYSTRYHMTGCLRFELHCCYLFTTLSFR